MYKKRKLSSILEKRFKFEKILSIISTRFIKTKNLDHAITSSLKDIGVLCNASRTYLFIFKDENKLMDNTHEWCDHGVIPQIGGLQNLSVEIFPWWMKKINSNEHIQVSDVSKLPEEASSEKEILEMQKIKSLLVLPLAIGENIFGFIGLDNVLKKRDWKKEDITILRIFSEILSSAFEKEEYQREIEESNNKLKKSLHDTVEMLGLALEKIDPYTAGHQKNVAELACLIAEELGVSNHQIDGIKVASLLHDFGKINVPTAILCKPSKISKNEFNLIKEHPEIGYEILKKVEFPWNIAEFVLQHHERIDGSGYPQGLKGEEISLEAKIIAVADVVEAMSSHRPYRPAFTINAAIEEIVKNAGILYDPQVVKACLKVIKEKADHNIAL